MKKVKVVLTIMLVMSIITMIIPQQFIYAKDKSVMGNIHVTSTGEGVFFTIKGSKNIGVYSVEYSESKNFKNSKLITDGVNMPFSYYGDNGKDTVYINGLKPGKRYYMRIGGMSALCGDISSTPWSKTYVIKAKKCNSLKKGEYATYVDRYSKKKTESYWSTKLSVAKQIYIIKDKLFIKGALCKYNSESNKTSSFGKNGICTYKLDKNCEIYMYNPIEHCNQYEDYEWINGYTGSMAYSFKSDGNKITSIKIWYSE